MGGDGSAPGGCRQRNTTCLTASPSAAGRLPPPLRSVSSRLLDLYHECMDNGGWVRVLYDAHGGIDITFTVTFPSSQASNASPPQPALAASPPPASPLPAAPSPAPPSLVLPPPPLSPQPAHPPRKRAKTFSEATCASSRAAVLAKKRQILQLDSCFSPPSPPSPPRHPRS
jgi:hypothetical protein